MGINNSENMVKEQLQEKGYDLIKVNQIGYPDFKVFNKDTNEFFYLEVKQDPIYFTAQQKKVFKDIKDKIIIALIKKDIVCYYNFKTEETLFNLTRNILSKPEPNITCEKCKYRWYTTTKGLFITCPHCLRKTSTDGLFIQSQEQLEKEVWDIFAKRKTEAQISRVGECKNDVIKYLTEKGVFLK